MGPVFGTTMETSVRSTNLLFWSRFIHYVMLLLIHQSTYHNTRAWKFTSYNPPACIRHQCSYKPQLFHVYLLSLVGADQNLQIYFLYIALTIIHKCTQEHSIITIVASYLNNTYRWRYSISVTLPNMVTVKSPLLLANGWWLNGSM